MRATQIAELESRLYAALQQHGEGSDEVQTAAMELTVALNSEAMIVLASGKVKESLSLLKKAHPIAHSQLIHDEALRLQLRCLTLNNMGCCMKKWNKPRVAFKLLTAALVLESEYPLIVGNNAGTHINIAASLSSMGMHIEASRHIHQAISMLDVDGLASTGNSVAEKPEAPENGIGEAPTSLATIAYFNLGVELEHMRKLRAALRAYTSACNIADLELGATHALAIGIKQSRDSAAERLRNVQKHAVRRLEERPDPLKPLLIGGVELKFANRRMQPKVLSAREIMLAKTYESPRPPDTARSLRSGRENIGNHRLIQAAG